VLFNKEIEMTQQEVFDLAYKALSGITDDWNAAYYEDLSGELKLQWIEQPIFQAQAYSAYTLGGTPSHAIGISYNLLWQLYLDIKHYFEYLESGKDDKAFKYWWGEEKHIDSLLTLTTREQAIQNIYMAAVTWVYFHELGHLSQEHGVIRNGNSSRCNSTLVECDIQNSKEMNGETSIVWHVTEIAADYFATSTCVAELIRHFNTKNDLLLATNYLMTGLAVVLHRFNGQNLFEEQSIPSGTHPKPFVRLELMIPVIFEMLSEPDSDDRKKLVIASGRAANTVSLYWIRAHTEFGGIPDNYFIQGMLSRPGVIPYMKHIVRKWDEIIPQIISLKRFGESWQELKFSQNFRETLKNS